MKNNAVWDRVEIVKTALGLKKDVDFYMIAGADKGLGGQWKSGQVQSIGAEYAFNIQDKTGFQARWLMLGHEPRQVDKKSQTICQALPLIDPAVIDSWHLTAQAAIEKDTASKQKAA